MADMLFWDRAWDNEDYEWPTTGEPDSPLVAMVGSEVERLGGRRVSESHADRKQLMKQPNPAVPGTSIRKQVQRCECRRQAQVVLPGAALRDCIVCDAIYRWPRYVA